LFVSKSFQPPIHPPVLCPDQDFTRIPVQNPSSILEFFQSASETKTHLLIGVEPVSTSGNCSNKSDESSGQTSFPILVRTDGNILLQSNLYKKN
jgi:hypothetical protein